MRIERRVLINAVAFLVAAVFLLVLLAVRILPAVFGDTYRVYGSFEAAGGVFTNQEVTYRGVQVGRVGEMRLTDDAVKIEMLIEARHRIPREETRARILYKSAVGEQFIDLLPETSGPPFFEDGDVIPLERTSIPIQTEDLLRELHAVLRSVDPGALGTVVHELGQGLRGHGGDLKQLLLALDTLAALGAQRQAEIAGLVRHGGEVLDAFNASREDFVRAAGSLSEVAEVLARRRADLERILDATQVLDRELLALLAAREAQINRVVEDLGEVTRLTHDQIGDLDLVLRYLEPMLSDIYRAYDRPFFIFNVLKNTDGQACTYDPSGRPVRAVTDDSPKAPATEFACAGFGGQGAGRTRAARGDRSWLLLYPTGG